MELEGINCNGGLLHEGSMKAAVEAPSCRAIVSKSKLISWAKELGSCIIMLSVMEAYSYAAEWHVIVIFHNCESHVAFYCYSGRVSSSPLPWAAYSCYMPKASIPSQCSVLRLRGLEAPGGTGWVRVANPNAVVRCLQALLDVLNADLT